MNDLLLADGSIVEEIVARVRLVVVVDLVRERLEAEFALDVRRVLDLGLYLCD